MAKREVIVEAVCHASSINLSQKMVQNNDKDENIRDQKVRRKGGQGKSTSGSPDVCMPSMNMTAGNTWIRINRSTPGASFLPFRSVDRGGPYDAPGALVSHNIRFPLSFSRMASSVRRRADRVIDLPLPVCDGFRRRSWSLYQLAVSRMAYGRR